MDNLYVYNKFDNEKAFKIPSEQVSQFLLPNKFSEEWIRVYCTSLDENTLKVAKKSFYEWCTKNNLPPPTLPQLPTADPQPKVFNDPIHGQMEFHPILVKIIDTPQFQRLRYLKQLGGAYFVYPGASHNRFEHSLGVAHLAGKLVRHLKEKQQGLGITDRDVLCVEIAGLCHDLGHGPFSHLFDNMFIPKTQQNKEWKHEKGSAAMFDAIVEHLKKKKENPFDLETELKKLSEDSDGDDLSFIKEMINGPDKEGHYKGRPSNKSFLYEIVANKRTGLDVDKFDYFARDCHHLGIKNSFDHNRYIKFARVLEVDGQWQICTRDKEVPNIYEMFHTRSSLHRKAYQHKTNKAVELMIRDALLKAEPVLKMSKAIKDIADKTMEEYTQLTDSIFEKILYSTGDELKEAREILQNILSRKLYRFLGETKLTDGFAKEEEKQISEMAPCETQDNQSPLTKEEKWKSDLAVVTTYKEQKPLTKDDFEITIISFDFGQKDKNPMDNLYVYNKFDNEKAFKIPSEQVSQFLLPNKFSEKWIRVYCTSLDKTTQRVAQKSFYEWCRRKNLHFSPSLPQTPTANPQPKVFNDPIHGHMEFHPILVKIIDTPQFQRLRFIKQMGGAYFVYPGASHNQFEHSLGVAHLAGKLVRHLKEKQQELGITDRDVLCVEIAGLCHDLGHGPFSHLFDNMFIPKTQQNNEWKHEQGSAAMFDEIVKFLKTKSFDLKAKLKKLEDDQSEDRDDDDKREDSDGDGQTEDSDGDDQSEDSDGDDLTFIKEMINGPDKEGHYKGRPSDKSFLYEIVANKRTGIDVDKFDYFARDCHHLGIKNSFDHNRYIKFARVLKVGGRWQICTRDKEVPNIYEMFHTRSSLHRKACQHKAHKAIELMIRDALLKAEPVLKMSEAIKDIADKNMKKYTQLTDSIFEKILYSTGEELKEAREILQNILSRKLYRFLGEIKRTDKLRKEKEEKWKSDLAVMSTYKEENPLTENDFEISIIEYNFGQKDKNPMDNLYVYNKFDNEKAFKIPSEQVSQFLLPKDFSEEWIRVYCTSLDENTLKVAKKSFLEWCTKNNSPPPSLPQTLTADPQPKVFNDPIHGQMEFHPILVKIIDTPQFQRLRFIKQLGGAYFVYPGACHTRFEHSLGVSHLAGKLVRRLKEKQQELGITDRDVLCVEIAGLCHDLGHGPFSRLFDNMFIPKILQNKEWKLEKGSAAMFDAIVEHLKEKENPFDLETELKKLSEDSDGDDLTFIKEMINGPEKKGHYKGRPDKHFLYEIVANKRTGIDVDKFDYFARDCHHLGIKNSFDHNRYIKFARVLEVDGQWQICTRDKEVSNIYEMFHTRSSLHRKAYQHKTNKAIELMIRDALLKADPVLKMSEAIKDIADKTMEEYTQLTDSIFEKILYSTGEKLKEAREILQNILSRKLYRFLGETKLTDKLREEKEEKWKSDLAEMSEKPLKKDDFEISVATFNFGQKDKNPMDNLYIYYKSNNEKAFKIPSEQVSQFLLPNKFSEEWIRVYCTSLDENTLKVAKKSFLEWCTKNNSPPPTLPQLPTADPQPK
ncbi:uncharacterized protein LOC117373020 [Periophthalmus magnuspinnatus]|uniref:uncharacterized protein LOC117373020 n=1 Tax=Periophthalmus magnuspinnatus TaxID=409849 RepID=UPI0024365103|nr:uncharacterized protein LOC117373020 [Periophthalmus magnuspinnatus]